MKRQCSRCWVTLAVRDLDRRVDHSGGIEPTGARRPENGSRSERNDSSIGTSPRASMD